MTTPPAGSEGSASTPLELARYFTRAGRDPLTLAPFEVRLVEGQEAKVPSSWAPEACAMLVAQSQGESPADTLLIMARNHAREAREQHFITQNDEVVFGDEMAWLLARGMGWVAKGEKGYVGVVNLAPFCEPVTGKFELVGLKQAIKLLLTAAAARAANNGQPTEFSCGWTNLAGLFLSAAIPYDSSRAVGIGGCLAAMILGEATANAARLAACRPGLAPADYAPVVRTGLDNAKARISDLPPTKQPAPGSKEPDRWQVEAGNTLEAAKALLDAHGILTYMPTSPTIPDEAVQWLRPIAAGAEPVPTLKRPDLASRPEVKNALRAIGLADSQKGVLLRVLETGGDLAETDVSQEKSEALRTALGSWSFHPNAQIAMATAVAPFIAGVLKHRVHLPGGVPDEFLRSLKDYGARMNLLGLDFGERSAAPTLQVVPGGSAPVAEGEGPHPREIPDAPAPEIIPTPPAPEIIPQPDENPVRPPDPDEAPVFPDPEESPAIPEPDEIPESKGAPTVTPTKETAGTPPPAPVEPAPAPEIAEPKAVEPEAAAVVETPAPEAVQAVPEPQAAKPETEAPVTPAASVEIPAPHVATAKAIRLISGNERLIVHSLHEADGRICEIAVTSYDADGSQRAKYDSFCQAVSVGLKNGVSLQAYADEFSRPGVFKDILSSLKDGS